MNYETIQRRAALARRIGKAVTYFLLTLWAIAVLFPFYWMVLTSVKSYGAYNSEWVPKLSRETWVTHREETWVTVYECGVR